MTQCQDEFWNLCNLAQIVMLDHDGDDDHLKHISASRTTILRQRNNTYLRKRTNHINSTPILSNVSYIMCLKFFWLKIILFLFLTIDLVRWCPLDMALPVSTPGVLVDLLSSVCGYFPIFYAKYICSSSLYIYMSQDIWNVSLSFAGVVFNCTSANDIITLQCIGSRRRDWIWRYQLKTAPYVLVMNTRGRSLESAKIFQSVPQQAWGGVGWLV